MRKCDEAVEPSVADDAEEAGADEVDDQDELEEGDRVQEEVEGGVVADDAAHGTRHRR